MSRIVLLDRDGVLCADRPDFVKSVDELEVLPGVAEALGKLTAAGVRLAVVSNQSCIGRGIVARQAVDHINATLGERLSAHGARLEGFFICPHAPDAGCACRKPRPGLIEAALSALHAEASNTWLLGDDLRDLQAAKAAGCRGALMLTGKGRAKLDQARNVPKFLDVADFSGWFVDEVKCDHP
jgi:D-glycero-D-manno-heptose 1,7-bisphosphate phosphatase